MACDDSPCRVQGLAAILSRRRIARMSWRTVWGGIHEAHIAAIQRRRALPCRRRTPRDRMAANMARCRRHGHEDDSPPCPRSIWARPTSPARRCSRASATTITRSPPRNAQTQRLFRPGRAAALRLQPCRGDPLVPRGGAARSAIAPCAGGASRSRSAPTSTCRCRTTRSSPPGGAAECARARSAMPRRRSATGSTRSPTRYSRRSRRPTAHALDEAFAQAMGEAVEDISERSRRRHVLRRSDDGHPALGLLAE